MNKLALAIGFLVLITTAIFFAFPRYERVDIVENNNLKLFVRNINTDKNLLSGHVVSNPENHISLEYYPENIAVTCNNKQPFKIILRNDYSYALNAPKFYAANSENIQFSYPNGIVLPPKSDTELTFFAEIDCSNFQENYTIIFTSENHKLSFTTYFQSDYRRE